MKPSSGIRRRLALAFGSLLAVFATAAGFAMAGLGEVHDILHDVKRREAGVRMALELASAVRDQYAHQAHTIILGNRSHLALYDDARRQVLARTEAVRGVVESADERRWLADIERASAELDTIFRDHIVPAVVAQDTEEIRREHGRAQLLVSTIQERTDRIAASLEQTMADFEAHASLIEHRSVRWSLAWFVLSIALAGALGAYVARSIAGPIAQLMAGAGRVAGGDLETRIGLETNDELGLLAKQFDTMTRELAEKQRHLIENEKLAGIGRLAAGVAHEINNPLAVILGYARILQRGGDASVKEDARVIEDEAVRCQAIVQDLLDLARPARTEVQAIALEEVCSEAIARLAEAHKLATHDVTVVGHAAVTGSPPRLRQVLMNLIQNAGEAAGPSGAVRAEISGSDGTAEVAIVDTGPGLTEEQRARLFEPFYTTKPKGTGLGLAVSRAIALAHGGDIEAERGAEGGTIFRLRLPRAPQAQGG